LLWIKGSLEIAERGMKGERIGKKQGKNRENFSQVF
jgi:hypothetical protein